MNGKTLLGKNSPCFGGRQLVNSRGLSTAPPSLRQLRLAKPGRSNRNKVSERALRQRTPPALQLRASLTKTGFGMVELYHARLTHRVHM